METILPLNQQNLRTTVRPSGPNSARQRRRANPPSEFKRYSKNLTRTECLKRTKKSMSRLKSSLLKSRKSDKPQGTQSKHQRTLSTLTSRPKKTSRKRLSKASSRIWAMRTLSISSQIATCTKSTWITRNCRRWPNGRGSC